MSQIFTRLFTDIDAGTNTFVNTTYVAVSAQAQPLFTAMFTLFIMLYGISIWMDWVKHDMGEIAKNVLKAGFVWVLLVGYPSVYVPLFVNPLTNTPNEISGAILSASGVTNVTSANSFLDGIWDKFETIEELAVDGASTGTGWLYTVIIYLGALISVGIAAILVGVSKIALALLLGLAPIFIITILFKGTNKFFEAWLQKCVNYMLIPILAYGAMIIPLRIVQFKIDTIILSHSTITIGNAFFIFIVSVLALLVLLQVMQIAAGLSGGIALSTLGVIGAFDRGQSRARGANRRFWDKSKTNKNGLGQRRGDKWKQAAGNFTKKAWSRASNRTGRLKRTG